MALASAIFFSLGFYKTIVNGLTWRSEQIYLPLFAILIIITARNAHQPIFHSPITLFVLTIFFLTPLTLALDKHRHRFRKLKRLKMVFSES
jgi:hypothetical protein